MTTDYLTRVEEAWRRSIYIAEGLDATPIQIKALKHLARNEFGALSGYRIHHFWTTIKDGNNNIALCFYETVDGEKIINSAHVRVLISQYGILKTCDMKTGRSTSYDPLLEARGPANWSIDKSFLTPFIKNGIQCFNNQQEFWCYVADKDLTVRPFFQNSMFLGICTIPGFEKCGVCRINKHTIAIFVLWHTDKVSGQQLFKLYELDFQNALKLKLMKITFSLQSLIKKLLKPIGIKFKISPPKLPTLKISHDGTTVIGFTFLNKVV
jgi:hypothetical protein